MPAVLADSGPLVAILDREDDQHAACVKALESIRDPLVTAWPVVAEVMHLLGEVPGAVDTFWEMLERGKSLGIAELTHADYSAMRSLMRKYRDQGMDLGDAALVRIAERDRLTAVFTLDRDFLVYRIGRTGRFTILPG